MKRALATRARTYLRRPLAADAEEFTALVRASDHLAPWAFPPDDVGTFRHWVARGERPENEQYLVCSRADDAIAGFVNLNGIQRGAVQRGTAGWAAVGGLAGRGHLTDGLSMVLELAFTQLRLHRVEADIQPGNSRSRALAKRCGLQLEGYSPRLVLIDGDWRDHERWGVHAEGWRASERATGDPRFGTPVPRGGG